MIGGVSLISLFDSCMNAFDYIESAKTYGTEYQKSAVKLRAVQLRLSRWEESVKAAADPQSPLQIGTTDNGEVAQDLLGAISEGLKATERVAKLYKPKENAPSAPQDSNEAKTIEFLGSKMRNMALSRQKHSSIKQKTRWALHDQRKFKNLIGDLSDYVNQLEALFPADRFPTVIANQKRLAKSEASELIQPSEIEEPGDGEPVTVTVLKEATYEVDSLLETAVKAAFSAKNGGHSYGVFNSSKSARVEAGDFVAPGMKPFPGHYSSYGVMNATDNVRVRYGNNYGGKGVFD